MNSLFSLNSCHYRYRLLNHSDLSFYQGLFGDPSVMKWIDIPWGIDKTTNAFNKIVSLNESNDNFHKVWIVESLSDGNKVGVIGLSKLDEDGKKRDIGIMIHPNYQLKGFTPEISKTIIDFGQKYLGLRLISCKVHVNHIVCHKLASKMGFEMTSVNEKWSYWERTLV